MGVEEDFQLAAEEAKKLPDKVSNEDKLKLYGLYKQGTVGDCDTSATFRLLSPLASTQLPVTCHLHVTSNMIDQLLGVLCTARVPRGSSA